MSSVKIQTTNNYGLFVRSEDNRPTDLKKRRKLMESMQRYGFLKSFPVVCVRGESGRLTIKDGQHRFEIAAVLSLPVHWVEEPVDFDVAVVNCTAKAWTLTDYAQKFARDGKDDYVEALAFAEQHGLPLGTAFALLAGTTSYGNCQEAVVSGDFVVKDRAWAAAVADVYGPMVGLSRALRCNKFIEACMAACRVPGFDARRLLQGAKRVRGDLVSYNRREDYLALMERAYNYGRTNIFALKIEAEKALRERNCARKKPAAVA